MKPNKITKIVEVYPEKGTLYLNPSSILPIEVYQYNGTLDKPDRVIARFYAWETGLLENRWLSAVSLAELFVEWYNKGQADEPDLQDEVLK